MTPSTDRSPPARLALAEDDVGLREAVAQSLREHGLEVVEACDGGSLIGILRHGNVSLVVTDLMMPGLRGDDVLRYYRQKGDSIPFVVITAAPAPIVEQVRKFDHVTLLLKPFTEAALVDAVHAALGIEPPARSPD